jgi:hypothetical protein
VLGPVTTDALNRAPNTSYGEVTGITQTMRNVGASVGIAILGTLLISENRSNIETRFEDLGATKAQADAVVDSLSQSGGGEGSGALHHHAGENAEQFLQAVQDGFAHSTQTVFYGMAIAMLLAGIVAVATIPRGTAPPAEILE